MSVPDPTPSAAVRRSHLVTSIVRGYHHNLSSRHLQAQSAPHVAHRKFTILPCSKTKSSPSMLTQRQSGPFRRPLRMPPFEPVPAPYPSVSPTAEWSWKAAPRPSAWSCLSALLQARVSSPTPHCSPSRHQRPASWRPVPRPWRPAPSTRRSPSRQFSLQLSPPLLFPAASCRPTGGSCLP